MAKTNHLVKMAFLSLPLAIAAISCGGHGKAGSVPASPTATTKVAEGVETVVYDSVSVTWIKDNAGDQLMPVSLFGEVPDSLIEHLSLQEGIPATVSVFLVEHGGKRILFDAGNGLSDSGLLGGLAALGISPEDITCICLTHCHGDHIGGLLSEGKPVFPNAEVYLSRIEHESWTQPDGAGNEKVAAMLEAYAGKVRLFEFGDTVADVALAIDAVGHTPGHTAYQVGKVLVVGDLMHGVALQKAYPEYCAGFDMDKPGAVSARERIFAYAASNGLLMAGMHFPAPAFIFPD